MIEKAEAQPKSPASTKVVAKSPLARTPHSDTTDRDPLDLIAEEFAEAFRAGKTPSVSAFLKKYPAHAADLQDLLPAVGQMESLKKLRRAAAGDGFAPLENMPERIGDYHILREIGRGGMGVVFEAEQESLGRKVALKILPGAARADADKRERFLREAQAAARLHHTNIVPVFGVGEDNGVPYYVMQYIRGCGLDDIVHGWRTAPDAEPVIAPRAWKPIVRLIAQAAEALEFAHSEGVLHRDVKPGNLLLDAAGHLWITDFGLAKLLGETTYTATGQVLGTFQYMAPEALSGRTDARTDVYGLGMTLYELMTGRMPYDETNPAVLVKLIGEKEPPSPRSIDSKIPRTLETICLKAIAREPSRRYQSAGEFAEDLRAYLVGRPISARRLSIVGRGWLWCRRNPEIAGLTAAILLTLGSSSYYGWHKYAAEKKSFANAEKLRHEAEQLSATEKQLRKEAEKHSETEKQLRKEAEQAKKKYQENLELSLTAIEKILNIAGKNEPMIGPPPGGPGPGPGPEGERPPPGPGFERPFPPDRGNPQGPRPGPGDPKGPRRDEALTNNAQLLEEILAFYEKFATANETNLQMKFDAARAFRRVAEIQFALKRPEKGRAAMDNAIRMFEELRTTFPEKVRFELEEIRRRAEMRRGERPPPP